MQVDEFLISLKVVRNSEFKLLFVPPFTNPANVFKQFVRSGAVMSFEDDVVGINFCFNQRMKRC
jgi:hypothetical protein